MAQFTKKSNKKWNLTTFEFFLCCRHPRLSHFQAENHRNVKYFKFLLVNRMMLYGYKTFRKSSEQGHKGPKKTIKLIFVILGKDKSHSFESFFGKMSDLYQYKYIPMIQDDQSHSHSFIWFSHSVTHSVFQVKSFSQSD